MRKTLFITLLSMALLTPLHAEPPEGEQDLLLQGLRNKIAELRSGGNFSAAAMLAEELLTTLQAEPETRRDQMVDAEWLLRTTRLLATLPDPLQEKLVLMEAWKREYRDLMDQRSYDRAERLINRVITVQKEILGTVHPETAAAMVELARVHMWQLRYSSADSLFDEGLIIQESTLGGDHVDVASTLASRARLFAGMKRFSVADTLSRRALVIYINTLGVDHPKVAKSLQEYAAIRIQQRDPVAAEEFLRRSYKILRTLYGESDPSVVRRMQDLADLRAERCDHAGAARLYEKALSIQTRKYGHNHLHVALLRKDVARSLAALGAYKKAEAMYREALDVLSKRLDPNHEIVGQVMNEWGVVLFRLGRPDEASIRLERALTISRTQGRGGITEAAVLRNYGLLFQERKQYARARELFAQAADIYRERLGETSPLFAAALFQMARALTGQHEYGQARLLLVEACRILENNRRRLPICGNSIGLSHSGVTPYRLLAFNELQMNNGRAALMALERDYADSLLAHFNTRWFRRLNPAEARQERYLEDRLVGLERLLANRTSTNVDPVPAVGHEPFRIQLARAQQSWDILQERLRRRYPVAEGHTYDLADIQASLQVGGVLVGWMDVENRHFVYLVPPYGDVIWKELAPASSDSIYTRLKSALAQPGTDETELDRLAREVYDHRLAPLEPYFERLSTLYVVPSGPMVGIPVEILPLRGQAVGSYCTVCYTPSGSFFRWLRTRPKSAVPASLLAIGDPPFNDDQARDMYLGNDGGTADGPSGAERKALFGALLAEGSEAAQRLPRLSATRREINNFADLFAPNSVLLGPDASETRLERINRDLSRFGFIHLATYAVPDRIRGERSALVLSQADVPDPLESIANGWSPVDGRLTLEEIVRRWRLRAEVVTLTVCEAVDDESSNGYLDFAYAFLQVGARSVVVNRWRVPDASTHILMNRFYENLAERELDKKRALDDAKAWLRDYATESGERPYRHPGYWASFALVGDPYWANN